MCLFSMLLKVVPLSFIVRFLVFIRFCLWWFIQLFRLKTEIHNRYENICELVICHFSCHKLCKNHFKALRLHSSFSYSIHYEIKKNLLILRFLMFCLIFGVVSAIHKNNGNNVKYDPLWAQWTREKAICRLERDACELIP